MTANAGDPPVAEPSLGDLPLSTPPTWESPSADPNDETFGDLVTPVAGSDGGWATLDASDVVLVGEPFDDAVLGRRGAAAGPDAIRKSLAGVKTRHLSRGAVGGRDGIRVGDAGNVAVGGERGGGREDGGERGGGREDDGERGGGPTGSDADGTPTIETVREAVGAVADAVHASGATPVFLGGDNSLTVPNVRALLAAVPEEESVGVVNLDAHLDVREVREGPTSGTPYRELLESGLDAYAVVGPRDFETTDAYVGFLHERGGTVVPAAAVGDDPEVAAARAREATADVDHLYVSVDCDVLDAAAAPGVSAPTPGGVTTRELFRLVGSLVDDDRLRGIEIVECAPPLDRDGLTVDAAARTVAHALSAMESAGNARRGEREDRRGEREGSR